MRDVCARAQIGGNFKRMLGAGKPGRKPKNATPLTSAATSSAPGNSNPTNELSTMIQKQNIATSLPVTQTNALLQQHPTQSPSKLSEPPALVPIQSHSANKKIIGNISTASSTTQHSQQQQLELQALTKANNNNNHMHNASNDALNISSFISSHGDNLNLCMDDSSLLTGDHDAFNMLDSEVELQQEEVETFAGSSEDNLTNFVIGDDIVLGSRSDNSSILHTPHKSGDHANRRLNQQPLPKLEPILRSNDGTSPKVITLKTTNNQKYFSVSALPTVVSCSSELIQETHASYFSLIRDFFCSTPNHRMRYDDLKSKIDIWLRNPITALNEWYAHAENWSNLLSSAINFLVGDFSDLPDEYVPYIEHKVQMSIYQWIGAGRDSDTRLTELCNIWMERRKHPSEQQQQHHLTSQQILEVLPKSLVESEDVATDAAALTPPPPPPRCPTSWTVRAATEEEILEFQRQERERFEQPHKAYTYCMYGYESVVGPVKGIYTPMLALAKARGHSMMVGDRPNFVTILTLVRDATARLPNGEGTRADISELLKCSQYINPDAAETVLQTIVSGALDRMHTEHDPCVRYDPKRKIWIYLHRNRTEEDFERIHQQNQNMGKSKKIQQRKPRPITASSNKLNSPDQEMTATSVSSTGGSGDSTNGSLLTLPALVPSNPIIVSNTSGNNLLRQQQQQLQKQQQIQLNKCPPVPPLKYNIPSAQQTNTGANTNISQQTQPQQHQQSQQKSLLKTTVRQENKTSGTSKQQHSFQVPQAKTNPPPSNTTPIIVATPQGLQTVHVSNATSVHSSSNINQQQNQQQSTMVQQSNLTANLAGKRVMLNKPIIINQVTSQQSPNNAITTTSVSTVAASTPKHKSPQQLVKQQNRITLSQQQQQQLQQQSNIITIPISMTNSVNINTATTNHVEPSSSSSSNQNSTAHSPSLSGKQNIIRLLPASNVKALLNAPAGGQVVNRQRIISTSVLGSEQRPNTPQHQQQQQKVSSTGFQLLSSTGNVVTINNAASAVVGSSSGATTTGSIVKMSAQAFAALQQKQTQQQVTQQQHIIVKQAATVGAKTAQPSQTVSGVKTQRVILGKFQKVFISFITCNRKYS